MFAGPNGSGKSRLKEYVPKKLLGVFVNADDIERDLRNTGRLDLSQFQIKFEPEYFASEFLKLIALREASLTSPKVECTANAFTIKTDTLTSYHAAVIAELIRQHLLEQKISFTFETVMSHESKINFLAEARNLGFRTYLYFIATQSPELNVFRVKSRVKQGGHDVPKHKILERYDRSIKLLRKALKVVNRGYVFDNSGADPEFIVETELLDVTSEPTLSVSTEELPAWILQVIEPSE